MLSSNLNLDTTNCFIGSNIIRIYLHLRLTSPHLLPSGPSKSDPYGSQSHTNRPVPVFYQGGCSQIINQSVGEGFDNYGQYVGGVSGFVDQVHLHLAMRAALIGDCLHIPVVYG